MIRRTLSQAEVDIKQAKEFDTRQVETPGKSNLPRDMTFMSLWTLYYTMTVKYVGAANLYILA